MPAPDSNSSPQRKPAATSATYADAGVDISAGDRAKQRIKYLAQRTFTRNVLGEIGGFGGLFRLDGKYEEPVLVSCADGVGTKLKLAFQLGIHHTVGADLVNHCVNDIAVQGATPLFFLDYLATGRLDGEVAEKVVSGLSDACRANGCALIGGETAQMPGFYADGEYDLAGFIVGVVERAKLITGAKIRVRRRAPRLSFHRPAHQRLLARPQALLRGREVQARAIRERAEGKSRSRADEDPPQLPEPHQKTHRQRLRERAWPTSPAAASPKTCRASCPRTVSAHVELGSWPVLPIFEHLQQLGNVEQDEMLRTFNMGIGLIAAVPADRFKRCKSMLDRAGEKCYVIGRIVKGDRKVIYA